MANVKNNKCSFATKIILIAIIFLAIGLSTLGSFYSAGDAYELKKKGASDAQTPTVVFALSNPMGQDEHGHSATISVKLRHIYVNVGAAYVSQIETATLRAEVVSTPEGNAVSSRRFDLTFGNFSKDAQTYPDIYYTWQDMMSEDSVAWNVSSYRYVKLSAVDANILINEVVFVGESVETNENGESELYLIPAVIQSATPLSSESTSAAMLRAQALLDSQTMPQQNSFRMNKLSDEEVLMMMNVREMREGASYGVNNLYTGDRVYGSVGNEILALGTLIFGMSPYGLRFFPMLAAAGALVVGAFLARRIAKNEKAGIFFAVLFALSCATLALGGLGTPMMIGVFFFLLCFNFCHVFYVNGMRSEKFSAVVPLLISGLSGALAILVHGAYVIPMLGVIALFVCGMVRLRRARRIYLDKSIAELEEIEAEHFSVEEEQLQQSKVSSARRKVAVTAAQYRNMTAMAIITFVGALVVGTIVLGLLLALPMYFTWLKLYDNPAAPTMNILALAATSFAGGFAGVNPGGMGANAFNPVYSIARVNGEVYSALYASVINFAALIAVGFGIVYAIVELVKLSRVKQWDKSERTCLRRIFIPAIGMVLVHNTAIFAQQGVQFVLLGYLFAFILAASEASVIVEKQGRCGKVARAACITELVLLAVMFILLFVFTTGLPVATQLLTAIAG